MGSHKLLICTVGGSPQPVVAALKRWKPTRVCFVHTPETKIDIENRVVARAGEEGVDLDPGRYDLFELPDGQDLASCLDRLRALSPRVDDWLERGADYRIVVDFTGGTKCMSAAVALQARRWPCVFSYVGGARRTKDGVGVVVDGAEQVIHQVNPWDALGHQAIEEFVVLFDRRAFDAAARLVEDARSRVDRPDRKRELTLLEQMARAFAAWDRFDHAASRTAFENVEKGANDLRSALGDAKAQRVLGEIAQLREHLEALLHAAPPSRHHVIDLLANAMRRREEGRFDDAVARLYRAIEAVAQAALKERHGIESTEKIALDRIPEDLRENYLSRARSGFVKLGLQDAYLLLDGLGDSLGEKFRGHGLDSETSPLVARNRSVLAHGFERVSDKVFDQLWRKALDLAEVDESRLPSFPLLGDRDKRASVQQ